MHGKVVHDDLAYDVVYVVSAQVSGELSAEGVAFMYIDKSKRVQVKTVCIKCYAIVWYSAANVIGRLQCQVSAGVCQCDVSIQASGGIVSVNGDVLIFIIKQLGVS